MSNAVDWIGLDWGTTHLRAFVVGADGTMLAEPASEAGMGRLERAEYEPALLDLIGHWLPEGHRVPVVACGMVGSRQGWVEAPYQRAPCPPLDAAHMVRVPTQDPRLDVRIIPGIRQDRPADVMRGEETQIAGFLAGRPQFDGVLCLPGTHSKWVRISAGEVVGFQTFLTGELFALLAKQSVLRHSVASEDWDTEAFGAAVADAISQPERFGAALFTLRAEALLNDLPAASARARLSGALIGVELAAARPYWLGQSVTLIGAAQLSNVYAQALAAQGLHADIADGGTMTLAGLAAARAVIRDPAKCPKTAT